MGINVSVFDCSAGKEHDGWDWFRHVGDKDLIDFICDKPIVHPDKAPRGYDRESLFRPVNPRDTILAFAKVCEVNQDRWKQLADMLEADQNLFLYASY